MSNPSRYKVYLIHTPMPSRLPGPEQVLRECQGQCVTSACRLPRRRLLWNRPHASPEQQIQAIFTMAKGCEVWVETLGLYKRDDGARSGPQGHDSYKAILSCHLACF